MKFIALCAVINDKLEEKAISIAKSAGAGSVTILRGQNIPLNEQKIFMGLTYEESVSMLLFVLPKRVTLTVMKALKNGLKLDSTDNGVVFTIPLSHLAGLSLDEVDKFKEEIKDTL